MTEFQIIKTDRCHVKSGHVRATIVVTTNWVSVFSQKYLGNIPVHKKEQNNSR